MDARSFAALATASQTSPLAAARRARYGADAVLSATPVQLVTMLYDRLVLDLERAVVAQQAADWPAASEQLLHAQAIVAELSGSLRVDVWDGGEGLLALYTYASTALVTANVRRDVERTREVLGLVEPLRQAWHEAAATLPSSGSSTFAGASGTVAAGAVASTGGTLGVA